MPYPRAAFTLIEMLVALLLVALGVGAALAVLLHTVNDSRTVREWLTVGPVVRAAAAYAATQGFSSVGSTLDLPDSSGVFRSPYALRVKPEQAQAFGAGQLVTYEVLVYDVANDRDEDRRRRGDFRISHYLRTR
jgi:prepilin-type N-terminal cleavage/methylation domain-containing protein